MKTPVLPCAILLPLLPLLSPFLPPTHASPTIDFDRWARNRLQAVAKPLADLDVGEPRTVRLVYFRPQDRPFRAEVVDSMKDAILRVQTWFAAEMQRHGHGDLTFRCDDLLLTREEWDDGNFEDLIRIRLHSLSIERE